MNSSFFSKAFQNATFPHLITFCQLARVYNHIRSKSCSISYVNRKLLASFPGAAGSVSCDWSVHRQKKTKEISGQPDVGSFRVALFRRQ